MSSREEYLSMLAEARKLAPEVVRMAERFNPPEPEVVIEGRKTHVVNFKEIAEVLDRDLRLIATYLSKKLGAPYIITEKERKLILSRRIKPELVRSRLETFVNTYVVCPLCKRPDSALVKFRRGLLLKCKACGAETPVPKF